MPLPEAVRKQVAEANRLQSEIALVVSGGKRVDGAPVDQPPAQTAEAPASSGQAPATEPNSGTTQQAPADEVAAPAPQQPPSPPPAPTAEEEAKWEQRYLTLKGKYDREVPEAHAAIRRLEGMVGDLNARMRQPQAPVAPQPNAASPAVAGVGYKSILTPAEVSDYGEDFCQITEKLVRGLINANIAPVRQDVMRTQQQIQRVNQISHQSLQDQLFARVKSMVPQAEEVDQDPEFIEWLEQLDPYAGQPRGNLLQGAIAALDADRVASFFRGYLAERKAVKAQAPSAPAAPAAPQKPSLDTFAAPVRGNSPPVPPAAQQGNAPIIRQSEIAKFYADKRRGLYKPEAADAREREFARAAAEGRVVEG